MKHLHTGQFKQVYKEVKTPLPHVNFLILGFLVWLEQLYLDYTIKANLDSAIDDYHKQMDQLEKWHKFGRSIYVAYRTGLPHCQSQYNTASETQRESWIAWVQLQQGRTGRCRHMSLAICWRSSLYQYHLSLRLTIMCDACDSNNMCGTDNISWQSQLWTAIIEA